MSTAEKIMRRLEKSGLSDYELVNICSPDTAPRPGIMVRHDYNGFYPSAETFRAAGIVANIAAKHGLRSETRGHYTATLIYC